MDQENRSAQDLANQGFVPIGEQTFSNQELKNKGFEPEESNQPFDNTQALPNDINAGIEDVNVTADTQAEEGVDLPEVGQPDETETDMMAAGATETDKTLQDYLKMLETPETETEQEADELTSQLSDLLEKSGGRGQAQLEAEREQNLPQLRQDLSEVQSKIRTTKAQYDAAIQARENEPISMNIIRGQQGILRRQKASELGVLQARALGLQGQVQTAQQIANRAVDLKYSQIEDNIRIYQAQLQAIQPKLNREQQKMAQAQEMMINDYYNQIEEEKENEKQVENIALQVLANGGDQRLADMIANADNPVEAATIAGELMNTGGWQYVSTPAKRDRLRDQGWEIVQAGGRTYARMPEATEMDELLSPNEAKSLEGDVLSMNQIDQFRRAYGWTPPYGFTEQQLMQYMEDNPNATPEELEAGARQAIGTETGQGAGTGGTQVTIDENVIRQEFSTDELKSIADKLGMSKWYTPKGMDIDRAMPEILNKVQQALSEGYTKEEVFEYLRNL